MAQDWVNPIVKNDSDYWQLISRLESGRAAVLKRMVEGANLEEVMNLLCEKAEIYNPLMKCSVLRLDATDQTLHPLASVSLPKRYCDALEGLQIGQGVGSCGTAAFSAERVIVEDINTHPYWSQYKELALDAGLQACWSEPVIGKAGRVLGTFAMYYSEPCTPVKEDLKFIETSARLAAVVFEHVEMQDQLKQVNDQLSRTVDERNKQLEILNQDLNQLLTKQEVERHKSVNIERATVTKKLLSGFAHEVNTPIGIATTSVSYAGQQAKKLLADIEAGRLTKGGAMDALGAILESASLCEESLNKTAALIAQFREIDTAQAENTDNRFCMVEFLDDLKATIDNRGLNLSFDVESQPGIECHSKTALWQVLNQLIDNSIEHGFRPEKHGSIGIHVARLPQGIVINYQDDGCGIDKAKRKDVFEPFFSTQRNSGRVGLGLNVIYNTIVNVYHGKVRLLDSPVGVRYEIILVH